MKRCSADRVMMAKPFAICPWCLSEAKRLTGSEVGDFKLIDSKMQSHLSRKNGLSIACARHTHGGSQSDDPVETLALARFP